MSKQISLGAEYAKGVWKNNPVFKQVLGMCPTLAVTVSAINGIAMALATTFVLSIFKSDNFFASEVDSVASKNCRVYFNHRNFCNDCRFSNESTISRVKQIARSIHSVNRSKLCNSRKAGSLFVKK